MPKGGMTLGVRSFYRTADQMDDDLRFSSNTTKFAMGRMKPEHILQTTYTFNALVLVNFDG
jgi:hypothetical protein